MNDQVLTEGLGPARFARPDLLLFMGAALGGAALYMGLHLMQFSQLAQTAAVAIVMLGYAFAVARIGRMRVRLDQAGDNAYYLGLLFTLTSMALALYEFSAAADSATAQIVSNFGIALASTILGIFLRVVLHQMRVDPADVESMTRIELAEAAKRVKSVLDSLDRDIAIHHQEACQRLNDVVSSFTEQYGGTMEELRQASTRIMAGIEVYEKGMVDRGSTVMKMAQEQAELARGAIDRLRAIEAPPLKLATRLEKVGKSLEELAVPVETLTAVLEKTGQTSSAALESIARVASHLESVAQEGQGQQARILEEIAAAGREFRGALAEAGTMLQTDLGVLKRLQTDAGTTWSEALRAQQAANDVLATLTEVTRKLTEILRGDLAKRASPEGPPTRVS